MVITREQAIRYLYALSCYDFSESEFAPYRSSELPQDLIDCVRQSPNRSQAPAQCINSQVSNPQDYVTNVSFSNERSRFLCELMSDRAAHYNGFSSDFIREYSARLRSAPEGDRTLLRQEINQLAQSMPSLGSIGRDFGVSPSSWPVIAQPLHPPACRNEGEWHHERVSVPGLRYQVDVVFPNEEMDQWEQRREGILFCFEVLKTVFSVSQIESILHSHSDDHPDFSIEYSRFHENERTFCGDVPDSSRSSMHYMSRENRLYLGVVGSTPVQVMDDHQRYHPTTFLYSFLNGFGQAFYFQHLSRNPEYAEAFRVLVEWTENQAYRPDHVVIRETPPISDIAIMGASNLWVGVPVFSQVVSGLNDPMALVSPQDFFGDLVAERALIPLINRWRGPEQQISLSGELHYLRGRLNLTQAITSGRPISSMRDLIHAHYTQAGVDLDWDSLFINPTSHVVQSSVGIAPVLPGVIFRLGYEQVWNRPGHSIGSGASLGLFFGNPEIAATASVLVRPSDGFFGMQIRGEAGLVLFTGVQIPFVGLETSAHWFHQGNCSIYFASDLRLMFDLGPPYVETYLVPLMSVGVRTDVNGCQVR